MVILGRIAMTLETSDVTALAQALWERRLWGDLNAPREVDVDVRGVKPTADWIDRYAETGKTVGAYFDADAHYYLVTHAHDCVNVAFDFEGGPADVAELLSDLPFEVASFETRHREWYRGARTYPKAPSFGGRHFRHGWACAFRGAGHHSLVSRRWLQYGPWQLHQAANDTTLVQFHDLDLDAAAALMQAKPAHHRMGITDDGAFLQKKYVYKDDIRGFYNTDRRVLEVVVLGRPVFARELRDACAARRDQVLGPDKPIGNVAFVFLDPAEARNHLPKLWPYALECWTIVDEVRTRLDTDVPPESVDMRR